MPSWTRPAPAASAQRGRAISFGPTGFLLALLVLHLAAPRAFAAREWWEYYLEARDRLIPAADRAADPRQGATLYQQALQNLRDAVRLKPNPAFKEQTYGLQFVDYFPYYYMGLCHLRLGDYRSALQMFEVEEQRGAVKRTDTYRTLLRLRGEAESSERQLVARQARQELDRLMREATELGRAHKFDEALARLAEADVLAKELDSASQRTVRDARERLRAAQRGQVEATARTQRIETALGEGSRLLEEGRPAEAASRFEEVVTLDPANAKALEGRRTAQDRILATRTREARERAFQDGKALYEAGSFAEALVPLAEAAADETNSQAVELLAKVQRIALGLRQQRDLQEEIGGLLARGDQLLDSGSFPEAQVAFEAVLRLEPTNVRARERLEQAERRTGEALLARWLPNEPPFLSFFEPRVPKVSSPTVTIQGVAIDDRGISRVELRLAGVVVAEIPGSPRLESGLPQKSISFQREIPIEPGINSIEVTAWDTANLSHSETLQVERRLRFFETQVFFASAGTVLVVSVGTVLLVHQVRRRRARRQRFNPYIAGAPVLDEAMYFGRGDLLARILNVLHHNSLLITGERRIGKTTFLYHLKKVLEADDGTEYRFFPVFTDLQGVPETAFFHTLAADAIEALQPSEATLGALRFRPKIDAYEGRDFSHDLQKLIDELKTRTDKKVKLALLIDEVDVLNEYSERVNQRLRGVFMKTFAENLVAVLSGVGIRRSWKSEVSPWYNFFDEMEISALTREEAEELIKKPVAGVFRYEPDAVEAILSLSRLKPYQIQKYCIQSVGHMLEHDHSTITRADVEAVRETVESESVAH